MACVPRENPASTDMRDQGLDRAQSRVKAVEYWIRAQLQARGALPAQLGGCISGAHRRTIKHLLCTHVEGAAQHGARAALDAIGADLADQGAVRSVPCWPGRTARRPRRRTVGKRLRISRARPVGQRTGLTRVVIMGKMNGAVGNFNAHVGTFPHSTGRISARALSPPWVRSNAYTLRSSRTIGSRSIACADARQYVLFDFARDIGATILARLTSGTPGRGRIAPQPCRQGTRSTSKMPREPGLGERPAGPFAENCRSRGSSANYDSTVLRNSAWPGHAALAINSLKVGLGKTELDVGPPRRRSRESWRSWAKRGRTVIGLMESPDAYDRLKRSRAAGHRPGRDRDYRLPRNYLSQKRNGFCN